MKLLLAERDRWPRPQAHHIGLDCRVEPVAAADELGDEGVSRLFINVARAGDLTDLAALHNGNSVGDSQRFFLIVGHVDCRDAELTLHKPDILPHLDAQLGVKIRQRLVHEQHIRFDRHRAGEADALLLPAGHCVRKTIGKRGQTHIRERLCRARPDRVVIAFGEVLPLCVKITACSTRFYWYGPVTKSNTFLVIAIGTPDLEHGESS